MRGGGPAEGDGRGGGRGDGTVYLAQLLFRRNSRHVMMKFSKSPFPDPGKRPRGGGGTRPPRPGPPRVPPARTVMRAPNAPQRPRSLRCRCCPRLGSGSRGCGATRTIFAVIPPFSPLPAPPSPLGSAIWSPTPEEGKGEGAIFWCTSAAACSAPAAVTAGPRRRLSPPARRPGRGPSQSPIPGAIPARCRYSLGRPSPPFHQVLDSALSGAGGKDTASAGTATPGAPRPPPPPAAAPRTFRIRFFSMLSTAKTCSPTAGSSIPQPGGAGPGRAAAELGSGSGSSRRRPDRH